MHLTFGNTLHFQSMQCTACSYPFVAVATVDGWSQTTGQNGFASQDYLKPSARYTGLRMSNVLELTWEQVDFNSRTVFVQETKNGEPLSIPLCHLLYNTLLALREKNPYQRRVFPSDLKLESFKQKVRRVFKSVCKEVGINDFRWYGLRHDSASQLVQKGVGLYTVQKLLGHKDSRMTQRYAHLSPKNFQDAIQCLDELDSSSQSAENLGRDSERQASTDL